ncbi:class I lanthipeptide [Chitinophaga flava]|uniref:Uncharacterized protein n=1 Tax=Chitinophaga flava TaxID=2259036 RepID=A0A365XYS2_9BACT|nr:class I lanthipeptide [Chitinophaga flava]RBL91141.1 hypothetical protein DF182_00525 [Chitinophaga flava]
MNKKKLSGKLSLNRFTVAALDDMSANNAKGGFTYSLSTGDLCKISQAYTANNAYECGQIDKSILDISLDMNTSYHNCPVRAEEEPADSGAFEVAP